MAFKNLSKTRWRIDANRVTIYPYGLFYIMSAILAVIFSGIFIIYLYYENTSLIDSMPLFLLLMLFLVLFWGYGGTSIEFDNSRGLMRKKLMGFIPVTTASFEKLQGINPISDFAGSYRYRLFRKDAKFGKGILVSCGYTRNDDPNALAFLDEAVTTIHGYLDLYDSPIDKVAEPITNYKYFIQNGVVFTVKNKAAGSIIFGLVFIALGIHELFPHPWLNFNGVVAKIFVIFFIFLVGAILINAGITKITIDQAARTISRYSPIGIGNKTYSFEDFAGIQTVRRSVNFIYTGTEVHMHFESPGSTKRMVMVMINLKKSQDIERFIQEVYAIMGNDHSKNSRFA